MGSILESSLVLCWALLESSLRLSKTACVVHWRALALGQPKTQGAEKLLKGLFQFWPEDQTVDGLHFLKGPPTAETLPEKACSLWRGLFLVWPVPQKASLKSGQFLTGTL